jgi:hypothetical protein
MASTRGQFIVEGAVHNGAMKSKDFHSLIFRMMTLSMKQEVRIRRITGRAVVRWKTKRQNEWRKRMAREESGDATG